MLNEFISGIKETAGMIKTSDSNMPLLLLGKWTMYLLVSRPLGAVWQSTLYHQLHRQINQKRRQMMNRFPLNRTILVSLLTFFLFAGCYTTFHTAREYDPYQEAIDDDDYYISDPANQYTGESGIVESSAALVYRPSRLVVEKTYYSYGDHIKKVKYTVYDPWVDTYYYSAGYEPDIYVSLRVGIYPPYRYHHPWWIPCYYDPFIYIAWHPIYSWYDPWFGYPGYYPVYYPVPIYYPYPVYYNPYYPKSGGYAHDFKKREWDRRNQTNDRRIARRGSNSGTSPSSRSGDTGSRLVRREETGNRETGQSGRQISSRQPVRPELSRTPARRDLTGNRREISREINTDKRTADRKSSESGTPAKPSRIPASRSAADKFGSTRQPEQEVMRDHDSIVNRNSQGTSKAPNRADRNTRQMSEPSRNNDKPQNRTAVQPNQSRIAPQPAQRSEPAVNRYATPTRQPQTRVVTPQRQNQTPVESKQNRIAPQPAQRSEPVVNRSSAPAARSSQTQVRPAAPAQPTAIQRPAHSSTKSSGAAKSANHQTASSSESKDKGASSSRSRASR